MKKERAIVTLLLGKPYQRVWQWCRKNWEDYAARHGADLIVLTEPLDTSPRAEARQKTWQKLLVAGHPEVKGHEQVVWLDMDLLIHPRAPWVGENVPPDRIGATDEYGYPTRELNERALRQLYRMWEESGVSYADNANPRDFYRLGGYDREFDRAVQSGVMVLNPKEHREILEHVYMRHEETHLRGLNGEMRPLSYELLKADRVHWLAPEWNALWLIEKQLRYPFLFAEPQNPLLGKCVSQALSRNYMLHFAGAGHELVYTDWDAPELVLEPQLRSYERPTARPARKCEVPVALLLFNRPAKTAQVMEAIRAVRPSRLYLIADGARPDHPEDMTLCAEARAIATKADWGCEVTTNFSEINLGLKWRVESGLDWLFDQVEHAIILEDDCLPEPTFFAFCEELLERYAGDERIFAISGTDYKFGLTGDPNSYAFSRYPLIWGWATWRRAWQLNDPKMMSLPEAIASKRLVRMLGDTREAQYWEYQLNDHLKCQTTWDSAWLWTLWEHDGLCIHPNVNLIENIGFGSGATHTQETTNVLSGMFTTPIEFPLKHPSRAERDVRGDALIDEIAFSGNLRRLWERVLAARSALKAREQTRG
jgi:hypothetical protein